ncbi:MAG TPA: hypothetical protein ENK47_03550 [Euryarchaeota archaeon]|nr:MAG: hypothetical protein B6U90_07475 [Thermoplasmatales archaeon ex4484_6]RLF68861.1 MAG: hypothetical protein DRN57_02720 [Thermoplasmata archaeon]HHD15761.1 hypothetical protein [Euryarchaeota archaeon]
MITRERGISMTGKIRIACATDDEETLISGHFGSAKIYMIYDIDMDTGTITFIRKVENTSPEEREHGDPEKARSVSEILKDAHVLLCCAMGKNIIRMRKKYCIVVSNETNIRNALERLRDRSNLISEQMNRGSNKDREIIRI